MRVSLNECEQRLAKFLGKARRSANRSAGTTDRKVSPEDGEVVDLEGIAGELAFCKACNVWPDMTLDERPAFDCVVGGLTVDVKSTMYATGRLLVTMDKAAYPAQYYALVTGMFPGAYTVRGVVAASAVFKPERIMDLGYGPAYAVPQEDLTPLPVWLDLVRSWGQPDHG